jgi:hypothetical protein
VILSVSATAPSLSYNLSDGTNVFFGDLMSISPTTLIPNGAPITSCTTFPALPLGLQINSSTCVISGILMGPLAVQQYHVTATNAVGSSLSEIISLNVSPIAPNLSYSSATGTVGTSITIPATLYDNGATVTCESSSLPAGLFIDPSTCVISGTPSGVVSGSYSITATNTADSITASVEITISPGFPTLSYSSATGTVGTSITIPATLYDNGATVT